MFYTDDPQADFSRHDAEQQRQIERLPRCDQCNEPIQDDYFYDINGEYICSRCMKDSFRKEVSDYVE